MVRSSRRLSTNSLPLLVAIGIEKVDAPRHAVIDGEADRHPALLELAVGVEQILLALEAKRAMREPHVARLGRAGALADLGQRDLVMVAAIARQEHHLHLRQLFHHFESQDFGIEGARTLEAAHLEHDVPDTIRMNHRSSSLCFVRSAKRPKGRPPRALSYRL